jgi:KDO2-lipid IV(A) lauroyltransferase
MYFLTALAYYLIILPISWLPFWLLYRLSDGLFYLLYYLIRYRKNIVCQNLTNSFPDKSRVEIEQIAKKFYRHFCDLIVEGLKMFSISENEVIRRSRHVNSDLLDQFYDKGQSVIIIIGHYNNWEMWGQACNSQMKHQAVAIYAPLRNKFYDKKFAQARGRNGMVLISKNWVKKYFVRHKEQGHVVIFVADQSPWPNTKIVHWMNFLNQDTPVMIGPERFAREYNYPIIFAGINKEKRGYYTISFELLEENPSVTTQGEITEKHTLRLEQQILAQPEYYLWTHRRWKRKRSDYPAS